MEKSPNPVFIYPYMEECPSAGVFKCDMYLFLLLSHV